MNAFVPDRNYYAPNGMPYWAASVAVPGWGQMCERRPWVVRKTGWGKTDA